MVNAQNSVVNLEDAVTGKYDAMLALFKGKRPLLETYLNDTRKELERTKDGFASNNSGISSDGLNSSSAKSGLRQYVGTQMNYFCASAVKAALNGDEDSVKEFLGMAKYYQEVLQHPYLTDASYTFPDK